MSEPEFYAEFRKEQQWRGIVSSRPGFEWDALRRVWKPVDYMSMSVEQLAERRRLADDRAAETEAQLKGLLPQSAAQALLNKGADEVYDLLIKLAKKAPEMLLGVI